MEICQKCGESFTNEFGVTMHQAQRPNCDSDRDDEPEMTEPCPACDKKFKSRHGVVLHLAKKHDGTPDEYIDTSITEAHREAIKADPVDDWRDKLNN